MLRWLLQLAMSITYAYEDDRQHEVSRHDGVVQCWDGARSEALLFMRRKLPTQLISQPTPGILVNWLTKRLQK